MSSMCRRREMEGLAKIGPWGGSGGNPQDIAAGAASPHRLLSVEVNCGKAVDALSFTYAAVDGTTRTVGPWGGGGGERHKVVFGEDESLVEVSGTFGPFDGHAGIVRSLAFVTDAGKKHGPFGDQGGVAFRVPVQSGGRVVGFFGRFGWLVDAVGVYVHP